MTGNPRKIGFWNRPSGRRGERVGHPGQSLGNFRDALTLEDAVKADGIRKARIRREDRENKTVAREAKAKAKITLPSQESLARLLKEISS